MTSFRWLNIQQTCELNAPLCWCKQKLNILLQKRTLVEIGRWSEKWESLLQSGRRDPLKYDPTCQRSRIIKMSPTTRASFHLRRKVEGKSWKVYDIYLKHLKIILKSLALVLVIYKSCLYQGYSEWRSSPISDMACQIHPAIPLHTAVLYVVHYRIRPRAKTVRVPHLLLEDPLVVHRIHSSLPASRNARHPLIKLNAGTDIKSCLFIPCCVSFDQFGKVDYSFSMKLQNRQTNINSLVTRGLYYFQNLSFL